MPKKLLQTIGRIHAEAFVGSQYGALSNQEDAKGHGIGLMEATVSSTANKNMTLFKQFVVKSPKTIRVLSHMMKYPYADAVAGVLCGVLTKQKASQIATNVVINSIATVATYEAGSSLGACIGGAIGSVFSPVGTAVGAWIGGFIGGIVAPVEAAKLIRSGYDKVCSFFSGNSRKDDHLNKSDSGPPSGGIHGSSNQDKGSLGSILDGGKFDQSVQYANSLLATITGYDNTGTGLGEFSAQLTLQGLVSSYNSCNGGQEVTSLGGLSGDIGGVATEAGQINGLKNSLAHLENQFLVCVKSDTGISSFTNDELRQIMGELALGIYQNKTMPFFSLHFNEDGSLYPVIHPSYQNTLIGQVISYLDYYMKGFLNGGIFQKAFLDTWHESMNTSREYLKPKLIDLKKQAKKIGIGYLSLRQMMAQEQLEGFEEDRMQQGQNSCYNTKFKTSFRIISKIISVKREANLFLVDASFDVQYTIDLMPDYKQYLENYQMEKGKMPDDYLKVQQMYRKMAQQIKTTMPRLQFCKKYFDLLKVITFICSYYKTLRQMMKVPLINQIKLAKRKVPKAFPPIPVRYYTFHKIVITLKDTILGIENEGAKINLKGQLDKELFEVVEHGVNRFDEKLKGVAKKAISRLLITSLGAKYQGSLNQQYSDNLFTNFEHAMVRFALQREASIITLAEGINDSFKKISVFEKINKDKLNSHSTISAKFQYLIEVINKNIPAFIAKQQKQLTEGYETSKIEMQKQIKQVKKQIAKKQAEENKQRNQHIKKEIERAKNQQREQLQQLAVQLRRQCEDHINNQINQIPTYNIYLYTTQIANMRQSMTSSVQSQISQTEIRSREALRKGIEEMEKKSAQNLQIQQKQRMSNIQTQFNRIQTQSKKQYQQKLQNIKVSCKQKMQKLIAHLRQLEKGFRTLTKQLLNNEEICKINIATKVYTNSEITIADKGYYQAVGDNFRIVGGCSVMIQAVKQQSIDFGQKVLAQVSTKLLEIEKENIVMQKINNQNYITFKTLCSDCRFSYDFQEIEHFFEKRNDLMQQSEQKLLSLLIGGEPIAKLLSEKKINLLSKNRKGLSVGHLVTLCAKNPQCLGELKHRNLRVFSIADDMGNLPIHTAVSTNQLKNAQQLIRMNKLDLQVKNNKGLTPLLCATLDGSAQMVKLLLRMGANPNVKLPNCMTPLLLALEKKAQTICLLLLQCKGVNVNTSMPSGDTPLHLAIRLKMTQVAKMIIPLMNELEKARTKSKGYNPLHEAAQNDSSQIIQYLLKTGKIRVNSKTDAGNTALHIAAELDYVESVKKLLQFKANVNELNKKKETPLSKAIINSSEKTALLLSKLQKIRTKNSKGKLCSLLACQHYLFTVFDILIQMGEDPNEKDDCGHCSVAQLIKNDQYIRFQALKKQRKIKNVDDLIMKNIKQLNILTSTYIRKEKWQKKSFDGLKMIHLAVISDQIGFVKQWLSSSDNNYKKLDIFYKDQTKPLFQLAAQNGSYKSLTAFSEVFGGKAVIQNTKVIECAMISGNSETIFLLVSLLGDINVILDKEGNTVSHYLVKYGLIDHLSYFLKKGLVLTHINKKNQTTASLAIKNNDKEMLKKLLTQVAISQYPSNSFQQILHPDKIECYEVLLKKKLLKQVSVNYTVLLLSAIRTHNLTDLKYYLDKGFDPNKSVENKLPIIEAVRQRNLSMVELLLASGADPQLKINGQDAIDLAVKGNQIRVLKIIQQNRKITKKENYRSDNRYTKAALVNNFDEFLQIGQLLVQSVMTLNLKMFQKNLKDFPLNELLSFSGGQHTTMLPLLFYCFKFQFEAGIMQIAKQVDPFVKDDTGNGLTFAIVRSKSAKQLIKYVQNYFPKQMMNLIMGDIRRTPMLVLASRQGNQELIKEYMKIAAQYFESVDQKGNYFTHLAVQTNNSEVVQDLLKIKWYEQHIDVCNNKLMTPLMLACVLGNAAIVKVLLEKGANPNKLDILGHNSLHYCIMSSNQLTIFNLLLPLMRDVNKCSRMNVSPLMLAASSGKSKEIKILIKAGASITQANNDGQMAIHYAARKGSLESLRVLVEAGADVNTPMKNSFKPEKSLQLTPLHFAAMGKNHESLSYLYTEGASITAKDASGKTPIEYAIQTKHIPTERLIKQFPFCHNIDNQLTLLNAAVRSSNEHLLEQFILNDYNINNTNTDGQNALHIAAINDSGRCAAILLDHGISPEAKDKTGNTALHYAAEVGSQAITQMLAIVSANTTNALIQTPLHLASKNNHLSVVVSLLRHGAKVDSKNKAGLTPAQIAMQNGYYQICQLLCAAGDKSLDPKLLQSLPGYFKHQLLPHQDKINRIQKILQQRLPSGFLIALKLGNVDAMKMLISIRPHEWNVCDPLTKLSPLQIAKQNKFEQAVLILTELQKLCQVVELPPPKKLQKTQNKSQIGQEKQNQKLSSREQVFEYLRKQNVFSLKESLGLEVLLEGLSTQVCIMFALAISEVKERRQFIKKWCTLLTRLSKHSSYQQFQECFLTYYSWNFFDFPQFHRQIQDVFFNNISTTLEAWFFKYYEPLIVFTTQQVRFTAVQQFSRFIKILKESNVIDNLELPPKKCISFWLDCSYVKSCIKVMENTREKESKKLQASYLGHLPEKKRIIRQLELKVPLINCYFTENRQIKLKNLILKSIDLEEFLVDMTNFIIFKYSKHLPYVLKFRNALKEIRCSQFSEAQKLVLSKIYFQSLDLSQSPSKNSHMYSFLQLSKTVKKHLGIKIFNILFNFDKPDDGYFGKIYRVSQQVSPKQDKEQQSLVKYCRISQLLVELNQPKLYQSIANKMPNLDKVLIYLNQQYAKYLKGKYPEKSMQILAKEFTSTSEFVKKNIKKQQFQKIASIYQNIMYKGQNMYDCSSEELKQKAQLQGVKLRADPTNQQSMAIVLACLREGVRRCQKIQPYNTQILSILGILIGTKQKNLKGRIAQVRTGEGKSTIIAILSAYNSLQGYFVDVITSSQYLAKRDRQKYQGFYRMFGITCSDICSNSPRKQMFNGQVLFGTNYDFQFSILRDIVYHSQLRYTERQGNMIRRQCEIVIVDEVDSLFLDMATNSARLAIPSPFHTSWIYQTIFQYVESQVNSKKNPSVLQLRNILNSYQNGLYSSFIKDYPDDKLKIWIKQAGVALEKIENKHYVIRYNKKVNKAEVIIVDYQNTGRLNVGSRWSQGLHQFVEVKHKIKPKDQSLTAAAMSHPAFFNQYQVVFGLSGTIGTSQERIEVENIYQVDSIDVPPHYPNQRQRFPLKLCKSQTYYAQLLQQIIKYQSSKRPILILMKTIEESESFSAYLKKNNRKHLLLNEMQKEDEDYIISKAGSLGSVVVATNTAGRGTDIVLSPQAKKSGGLHVIFGFYPANSRVQDQGLGRAARQGQKGSCIIIISSLDQEYAQYKNQIPEGTLDIELKLFELREKRIKLLSQQREMLSQVQTVKYKYLKIFCSQLEVVRQLLLQENVEKYLPFCNKFRFDPNYKCGVMKESPFMQQMMAKLLALIQFQKQGRYVDWTAFVRSLIEQQRTQLLEKWGIFFSNIIEAGNIQILGITGYKAIVQQEYYKFQNNNIMPYKNDLENQVKETLKRVLQCGYEYMSQL